MLESNAAVLALLRLVTCDTLRATFPSAWRRRPSAVEDLDLPCVGLCAPPLRSQCGGVEGFPSAHSVSLTPTHELDAPESNLISSNSAVPLPSPRFSLLISGDKLWCRDNPAARGKSKKLLPEKFPNMFDAKAVVYVEY
ncbi:hypothetical protein B0H14DRAFT_3430236 [Mycena olivaceomarginata]|nr:hypothetical protein B0H14DRAFT_3430236 [Mycena olivaceomarginata]